MRMCAFLVPGIYLGLLTHVSPITVIQLGVLIRASCYPSASLGSRYLHVYSLLQIVITTKTNFAATSQNRKRNLQISST